MDLKTSEDSVIHFSLDHVGGGQPPIYSCFVTTGCVGMDVLSRDMLHMPSTRQPCFGFCFPPTLIVEPRARPVYDNNTLC